MAHLVNIHSSPPMSYCKFIGRVICLWANLEFQVERLIWVLVGIGPKEGRLLTTQMNIRPKLEILKGLVSHSAMDEQTKKRFLSIIKAINKANETRNMLAHGLWSTKQARRLRKSSPRKMQLYWSRGSTEHRLLPRTMEVSPLRIKEFAEQILGFSVFMSLTLAGLKGAPAAAPAKP